MDGHADKKLLEHCEAVLKLNNLGSWTRPAPGLYPHQWLWDSCFIAIGLRHQNVKRAQKEILSLFRGQWKNGMIPNIIYGKDQHYRDDIWRSHVSKDAPKHYRTSGITQPPLIAEAVVKIGEKLSARERKAWYKQTFPHILAFHEWLYRERDPHHEGLVVLIHPWESGLDNNPGWIRELHLSRRPFWVRLAAKSGLLRLFDVVRKGTRYLPAEQRTDLVDALTLFNIVRRLARKKYKTSLMLRHAPLLIEDVLFNSILIRANDQLLEIAGEIKADIPQWLLARMKRAPRSLDLLWDETDKQYYHRNFTTFELIDEPSVATFAPLYAGTVSKSRAAELVELLKSSPYWTSYPIPSVPTSSQYFQPLRYWQGPTWLNTNWLIAEGLERYGYHEEAARVRQSSLELVRRSESYEYFSPLDGTPAGARSFSWTAALAIDFLYQ